MDNGAAYDSKSGNSYICNLYDKVLIKYRSKG